MSANVPLDHQLLTAHEVAELLRLPVSTIYGRHDKNCGHCGQGVRDRTLVLVSEPEIHRNVIQIDSHGRDQAGDIEPARSFDQTSQDKQTQYSGSQMCNFINRTVDQ